MNRKWFGILLIVFGIILIGVFAYLFFVANRTPTQTQGPDLPGTPFSDGTGFETGQDTTSGTPDEPTPPAQSDKPEPKKQTLFQITDTPITGYGAYSVDKEVLVEISRFVDFANEDGSISKEEVIEEVIDIEELPRVRYHDMQSGRIYETVIDNAELKKEQLTDDPINGMYEAVFADENTIFFRYYDDTDEAIATYRTVLSSSLVEASCPFDFTRSLVMGDTGPDVSYVQGYLVRALGLQKPLTPATFDQEMKQAVEQFQERVGIAVDGAIGPGTNRELQALCLRVEQADLEREIAQSDDAPFVASGVFVDRGILQLAAQPGGEDIFALINGTRSAQGVIMDTHAENRETVYDLDFRDWIVEWPSSQTLSFATKSSGWVEGSGYLYDLEEKDFFNIAQGIFGLTMRANADATRVLASESEDEWTFHAFTIDVATRAEKDFPLRTLPEKCVWSQIDTDIVYCAVPEFVPVGLYPDRWYQNQVSFEDTLWRIDTRTGRTAILENFREAGYYPDAIQLMLNEDETFLFYVDKKTGYLWGKEV